MLVLLSFALVLVATVLLVLGLLSDDGLLLIYLSIGSSVLAAVVLLVALRANRPRQEAARTAPAPLPEPEPEPVLVGAAQPASALAAEAPASSTDATVESGEWLAGDQDAWAADDAAAGDDWDGEVDFPIADYDTLTTGQILPLLPQLYADEIDVVEERERATKGRAEILAKLAQLRTAATVDPLASYTEDAGEADDWFPIEDYESLSAAQIRPLLRELESDELEMVRARELSLGRRQTLLDEIGILLGDGSASSAAAAGAPARTAAREAEATPSRGATAPAKRPSATKAAPAKRSGAAKKAATKATSATKATPAKKSAATKKAAATKAAPAKRSGAAKKSATKATPAKKAGAAKKAATKATPAKKAGAAKKAATKATPAKKAGAAKKSATKATPAKKATKRSGR